MKLRWLEPLLIKIVPVIIEIYSNILGATTRVSYVGSEDAPSFKRLRRLNGGCIFTCWHSRFFFITYSSRRGRYTSMVSASNDGELVARALKKMRSHVIRGSSRRQGREALHRMVKLLRSNQFVFILPDAPTGPRHVVKPGVIRMAQLSGKPILPLSFSTTKGVFFSSWDRFLLPLPFGKAVYTFSDLIHVPSELTSDQFEQKRLELEQTLKHLRAQADKICGRNHET